MTQTGRRALFRPKDGDRTYRVVALTQRGQQLFEQWRARLQKWSGFAAVSDADVVEALARGATIEATKQHIDQK
jgi:hypothetical protein